MMVTPQFRKPSLIVVTGRPGAGKTTLAHALALKVRCPAICRDEIKEGLVNTIGPGDIGREVYDIFFDTVDRLLRHRITLIAEAAFQHKLWAPRLQPLIKIARIRIVLCQIDPALAGARHIQRGLDDPLRERFHEGSPTGNYDPPRLDVPTLTVDTTDGYRPDLDSIATFATA